MAKNTVNSQLIKLINENDPLMTTLLVSAITVHCLDIIADKSDWGDSIINKAYYQSLATKCLDTIKMESISIKSK